MSDQYNPYDSRTLQGNWWEERFFHADTRGDAAEERVRPAWDEVENIPRVARKCKPTGEVFRMENDETPDEHFRTVSMQTYVQHDLKQENVTQRRMNATAERLAEILAASPPAYIPNHSLPARGPEKQFKTTYQKAYCQQPKNV